MTYYQKLTFKRPGFSLFSPRHGHTLYQRAKTQLSLHFIFYNHIKLSLHSNVRSTSSSGKVYRESKSARRRECAHVPRAGPPAYWAYWRPTSGNNNNVTLRANSQDMCYHDQCLSFLCQSSTHVDISVVCPLSV